MTKRAAVYAGSFDPVTMGHMNIIERGSQLFDVFHVVVGFSTEKQGLFTPDERADILKQLLKSKKNIQIHTHSGLTVDFAKQHKANFLVRGLRTGTDYTYEMTMAEMNRRLSPGLETVWFPSHSEYFHVSSSLVKEIAKLGGDIGALVPPLVAKKLTEKTTRRK